MDAFEKVDEDRYGREAFEAELLPIDHPLRSLQDMWYTAFWATESDLRWKLQSMAFVKEWCEDHPMIVTFIKRG